MRRSIVACGLLLAFAGMSTAVAAAAGTGGSDSGSTPAATTTTSSNAQAARGQVTPAHEGPSRWTIHHLKHRVLRYRAGTKRWLTVMLGRPPHLASPVLDVHSAWRLRRLAHVWHRREHVAWRKASHPPDFSGWLCIHHYEGSWSDPNAPYWGGLQMDMSFQETYGGWLLRHEGTADHWSPLEQMWVAVRAWRVRGFSPWPNTARDCGLYA